MFLVARGRNRTTNTRIFNPGALRYGAAAMAGGRVLFA